MLLLAGCLSLLVGVKNGHHWADLEKGLFGGMAVVFAPCFILLAVGLMVASWIAGGVVPTMIYYGLVLLNPDIFYAAVCLMCAIVSLSIGSSWTTAASVGVAMIGTAIGLGLSPAICAGAVISGAYFGDKMSPFSDTTNLAPAVTGEPLFSHIRHMTWTTFPSMAITLIIFIVIGLSSEALPAGGELETTLATLNNNFTIAWYMLLPLAVLFYLAWNKVPALPAIIFASLLGLLFAFVFQPSLQGGESQFRSAWELLFQGYAADTGDPILDDLLSGGGAANMLNTIWLILCAIFFGGSMEQTGMLKSILTAIMSKAKSAAAIISSTVLTSIGANIIAADQYMAIVIVGRMYKSAFLHHKLSLLNLSRAVEDGGTVTSALIPWNTCGAFMAATLGVPTMVYLPFCFFNLLMPVISIAYGITHFKILPLESGQLQHA